MHMGMHTEGKGGTNTHTIIDSRRHKENITTNTHTNHKSIVVVPPHGMRIHACLCNHRADMPLTGICMATEQVTTRPVFGDNYAGDTDRHEGNNTH